MSHCTLTVESVFLQRRTLCVFAVFSEEEAPPLLTGRELPKPQRTLALLPMATRKSDVALRELAVGVAKQGGEVEVMETHTGKAAG